MKNPLIIQDFSISGRMPLFTKENRQKNRDGVKGMTRRLMKEQPAPDVTSFGYLTSTGEWQGLTGDPEDCDTWSVSGDWIKCPYGEPGQYRVMAEPLIKTTSALSNDKPTARYMDDDSQVLLQYNRLLPWRWKREELRQRYMPTEAGRSVFLIEDITVERLGNISEEDISKEGIDVICHEGDIATGIIDLPNGVRRHSTACYCFESLWQSIFGSDAWERDKDKWVWVISYRRVA